MTSNLLIHNLRPAQAEPSGALVVFHGRGANEQDLEPLIGELDPERRLLGILPRGPLSLPPGGSHWYLVRQVGYPDPETFLATFERASQWLDAILADHGLAHDRLVLAGFSQGAVMSYALGLGAGRPRPAAILAMSGFLPRVEGFELELASRAGLPVSISHGTNDPIISVRWGIDAKTRLESAGLAVSYREDPAEHRITLEALDQARTVLRAALSI